MIYHHRGELGDILYAMSFIRDTGGGTLFIDAYGEHARNNLAALAPLAALQPYLAEFGVQQNLPGDTINLRERIDGGGHYTKPNIIRPYWEKVGLPFPAYTPWLAGVVGGGSDEPYSVVNVTERYRDAKHVWGEFLPAGNIIFLGVREEFAAFGRHMDDTGYAGVMPRMEWVETPDMLAAAKLIAGARAFFGNASACLALAQGVGQPNIYVEANSTTHDSCLWGHEHILNEPKVPA